jgi:hypothetical protein
VSPDPPPLPPLGDVAAVVRTRRSWHTLAEHVLAPARYRVDRRIGLRATEGGFGTPVFGDREQLRVDGGELAVSLGDATRRIRITTVAEAAAAADIEPGAPKDVYPPTNPLEPDAPLEVTDHATRPLAAFFAVGAELLEHVRRDAPPSDEPSDVQLWPEHFDLGLELGDEDRGSRATYGASPGNGAHDEPYLYVMWWTEPATHPYWNDAAFPGASLSYSALAATRDPRGAGLEFFVHGHELLHR